MVGSRIAAQLLGLAGGLIALASMPSCNIQVGKQQLRTRVVTMQRRLEIIDVYDVWWPELKQW